MEQQTEHSNGLEPTPGFYELHKRYIEKLEIQRKQHNRDLAEELRADPHRQQDAFIRRLERDNSTDLLLGLRSYEDYDGFVQWWNGLSAEERRTKLYNYRKTKEDEEREHAAALNILLEASQEQERKVLG